MLRIGILFAAGCIAFALAGAAGAQQAPPDPRLTQPTIAALEAVLALREAELKALRQDDAAAQAAYESRLATALEWLKAAQAK